MMLKNNNSNDNKKAIAIRLQQTVQISCKKI